MTKQIKVLFVDDDTTLGSMVSQGLTFLGYSVHYQSSMIALESIINEFQPNIIILDVEIGDKDGIDDSSRIRALFPNTPIIFVSSHIEASYVERALESGGTTYLKKPLDISELAAYVKRYAVTKSDTNVSAGLFSLNLASRVLLNSENNDSTILNKKESELLNLLITNANNVVSRETIIAEIWNGDYSSEQVLNNYISRLRKCLSEDPRISIKTVPREGYHLVIDA